MEYPNSTHRREVPFEAIFNHTVDSFEITASELHWKSPCWLTIGMILSPRTAATHQEFQCDLSIDYQVDAYAKEDWSEQLWRAFAPIITQTPDIRPDEWFSKLIEVFPKLTARLKETPTLFQPPFRFVGRKEFVESDLEAVLKTDADLFDVYLASEKGRYHTTSYLRIHSHVPITDSTAKCQWYQKRIPAELHLEDILPWFLATVKRLPKKKQPAKIGSWVNRLLQCNPTLARSSHKQSKLVIVFGAESKVGFRQTHHINRSDLGFVMRRDATVIVSGTTHHHFVDGNHISIDRTFYFLTTDAEDAKHLETQMLRGERNYFGLNRETVGMVQKTAGFVHAINVPIETVKQLCLEPGIDLQPVNNPREKHKIYQMVSL